MTTIRVAKRDRFTSIDRNTLNDTTISFRARGILAWLLDKPDNWVTNTEALTRAAPEGTQAVRTALHELETAGYLERSTFRNPDGTWGSEWTVHERPCTKTAPGQTEQKDQTGASPDTVIRGGSSAADNRTTSTKTERQKTEDQQQLLGGLSIEDEFEIWWKLYPRKDQRGQALEKYRARRKSVRAEDLLKACQNYAEAWHGADLTFALYGKTFLNEQNWADWLVGPPAGFISRRNGKQQFAQPLPTHPDEVGAYTDFDDRRRS